jgi:hypothetical protein
VRHLPFSSSLLRRVGSIGRRRSSALAAHYSHLCLYSQQRGPPGAALTDGEGGDLGRATTCRGAAAADLRRRAPVGHMQPAELGQSVLHSRRLPRTGASFPHAPILPAGCLEGRCSSPAATAAWEPSYLPSIRRARRPTCRSHARVTAGPTATLPPTDRVAPPLPKHARGLGLPSRICLLPAGKARYATAACVYWEAGVGVASRLLLTSSSRSWDLHRCAGAQDPPWSGLERNEKGIERRWRQAHPAAGPAPPLPAGARPITPPWRIGEKREGERGGGSKLTGMHRGS